MLEFEFDMSVGHWICSTSHAIRKTLSAHLSQEGITLRQFEVLATLAKMPECGSQTQIAEILGIEPHTLAGVLKRMERDGLLDRTACHHDRRKNIVQPTVKAEEMWQRAIMICRSLREDVVRGFTPEELDLLRSLCQRLQDNVEAIDRPVQPAIQHPAHSSPVNHSPIPFSPMIHP